jgi:hypothetical protein
MVMVVATLFVFAMAAPVMADRVATFEGTVTAEGKLMTSNGSEYWLNGRHADQIESHVGKKVEIKGLLREKTDSSSLGGAYRLPSIEVHSYKWMNEMNEMK